MIELHEVGLVEGLPPDVAKEPWVQILDAVFRERRKKELEAAERLKIYTDIDRADEAVLDILAVQFRVDWYDTSYPIETKRRIIKTALEVRRYCGTEWAVQKALASIYPNVKISEWYDYGGRPGYWRMNVDITDDGVIYYTPEEIEKRLGYARRCTAHLEHIIYIVEPHERSPAYIAAAPVKVPGRIKPREIGAKAYVAGAVGRSKMQVAVALPGAIHPKNITAQAYATGRLAHTHETVTIKIGGQTT
jgi:phage tail P2-like protein